MTSKHLKLISYGLVSLILVVALVAYLGGSKPKVANLQAAANRKIIQANIA